MNSGVSHYKRHRILSFKFSSAKAETMERKYMIFSLFLIIFVAAGESKFKIVDDQMLGSIPVPKPPKPNIQCNCEGAPRDILVCASNGITYKSTCTYECAKQKVPRLRIAKQGTCIGMTRNNFHRSKRFLGSFFPPSPRQQRFLGSFFPVSPRN